MSHVIWETPEGKWSRGSFVVQGDEVDYQRFSWASCDHLTKDGAVHSDNQDIPYTVVLYSGNEHQVAEYEKMASDIND